MFRIIKSKIIYSKNFINKKLQSLLAYNRNFLFLESFTIILIASILGNIMEFVARLVSDHPTDYFLILGGYIAVFGGVIFVIYKITYKPPKYEKMVNQAREKETTLIEGLKSKIETIDDKKAKKQKNKIKKSTNSHISESTKIPESDRTSTASSSKYNKPKVKNVHRRR